MEVVEEWKWMGMFVWLYGGIICIGEFYKLVVKLIFVKGVLLEDLVRLFNLSFDGNIWCVIDICEGEVVDVIVFKVFICVVIVFNIVVKVKFR